MPQCTIDNLKSSFSSIRAIFSKSEKSFLETMESMFKQLISKFNSDAITYCLENYIGAELDYTAPENLGLGRMTTIIPRFGAYFRKPLSMLSHQELDELYLIIQEFCIRGYLAPVLFVEEPIKHAKLSSGDSLYKEWIPRIYVSNPLEMGPNLRAYIDACTVPVFEEIYSFMRQHGMKTGIIFNRTGRFLSMGKVNEIISYYILAGFGLRVVEVGGN